MLVRAIDPVSTEPHVRFDDVRKTYDGVSLVVRSLNLDVAKGEFLTLLGPSGSGKTTTLMMLAGFEPATHGKIYVAGRPINALPPHKRGIGMVFQNYALFPHMTVAENLAFPLRVRGVSAGETGQRIARVLDMVGLSGMDLRRPNQLSGGQQQRVAVARALVFEPELVLMDEPLGALDKQMREQMQYEVKHIHRTVGVTVVYVTHDQSEALTMSDRIAVFRDGVVEQLASPKEIYEHPASSFVAQFIGENNRLAGQVESVRANVCSVRLDSGDLVSAMAVRVASAEGRTKLSIRPERVFVNPREGNVSNRIAGQVEELVYLGDHVRVRIALAGRNDFIVKVPNRSDAAPVAAGDQVVVGWTTEDCRALDPD